ncbi:DUF1294 domain-containing protein [Pararhizobium antarcticum]|uniref:Cold-shock protein n=1 Tax=Pararhizobium antarcticum TaxID=1798805 RepID=A0A657LWV4_9HYPH|nr:DUF1294 domain-containing protein [Pararhizobium antarcticum]OJG00264.1 hypothetical protein AX760_11110 [Pararhizobium antarcticum]OJG00895.1 hypothetical protein AX761_08220 [Rhizobium sp. 58]
MTNTQAILLILALFNVVTFCVYWWDKEAARDWDWRVSEARLLQFALFGGSLGAVAAQKLLRHKTQKEPFRSHLRFIIVIHITAFFLWLSAPLWLTYLPTLAP